MNELSSDHRPVLLIVDSLPMLKQSKPSLINGTMDWDKFRGILEAKIDLKIPLKSPEHIDDAVSQLVEAIQTSVWGASTSKPMKTTDSFTAYSGSNTRG